MGTFIFLKFRLFMDKNTLKLITVGCRIRALTMGMNAWADKTDTATRTSSAEGNPAVYRRVRRHQILHVDPVGDKKLLLEQALTGMVSAWIPTPPIWMPKASRTCRKGLKASSGGLGIEVTKDGKRAASRWCPRSTIRRPPRLASAGDIIIKIDNTFTYDLTHSASA